MSGTTGTWVYQGRQNHAWFGHGTAPKTAKDSASADAGTLFAPASIGQRIDYAASSVIGHVDRKDRGRWESSLGQGGRGSLKTAVAAWYGAAGLSRDAFRAQFLDPNTSDETVDHLRDAAAGMVEARTYAELGAAGAALASAVASVGVERWPRYLGDANARAVAAASAGHAPGVVRASAAGTDVPEGIAIGGLILLYSYLRSREAGTSAAPAAPSGPSVVHQAPPAEGDGSKEPDRGASGASPDLSPGPGGATVSPDRREHILNGDKTGGGHGPGRNKPGKSEFPKGWSDDKIIQDIKDVANDPASSRTVGEKGRIVVEGSRDGIDIRVVVEPDKSTIVTGYPTNTPRNPKGNK